LKSEHAVTVLVPNPRELWNLERAPAVRGSMKHKFHLGDHVTWNSEAGHVRGHIVKIHTSDVDYMGHTHRCSPENPQYEIKSDKTDHHALHKESALHKLAR
jgi:hypothetical protein